jgi:hypothetical protein
MIGLDNVRMDEIRDELGFANEILDEAFLIRVAPANYLDGDPFDKIARAVLFGFIDNPHAAIEYLAHNFIAKLALYGEERWHKEHVENLGLQVKSRQARSKRTRAFPASILAIFLLAPLSRKALIRASHMT